MKKYRLIKEYFNSPKKGSIFETNSNNECWYQGWFNPKEKPDNWQEIKDEYEVVQIYYPNTNEHRILNLHKIIKKDYRNWQGKITPLEDLMSKGAQVFSVKRLSDNEIFSIGDKVNLRGKYWGKITKISLDDHENFDLIQLNEVPLLYIDDNQSVGLIYAEKYVREYLGKTEDGKDIYVNDTCWTILGSSVCKTGATHHLDKMFASEGKAKRYLKYTSQVLSLKDVSSIMSGMSVYQQDKFYKLIEERIK